MVGNTKPVVRDIIAIGDNLISEHMERFKDADVFSVQEKSSFKINHNVLKSTPIGTLIMWRVV